MKVVLGISLLANFILGYLYLTRIPEKEVVERLIIETHADKNQQTAPVQKVDTRKVVQPEIPAKEKDPGFVPIESVDIQDASEKMEAERTEFMTNELGMTEDKIKEHNRLRDEFYKKTAKYWQKNPMGELSFKERREMIDQEEQFHAKLEKLYGKKNWERFQKYRENYNKNAFKRQQEEQRPFVFMGL